jgi:cytidylate kinase
MKPEYNFSKAERGKFFRKNATLQIPIYLEPDLEAQLSQLAEKQGIEVSDLVAQIVKRDLAKKPQER